VRLLSADSKQVYQGLAVLTGADIPINFQQISNDHFPYPYFQNSNRTIELHGVSCVGGDKEWSMAHFQKLFKILWKTLDNKTALIVVGGTGLYHQQILKPAPTSAISPNQNLRKRLELKPLAQLQTNLKKSWAERWEKMNQSDRSNPRRLIRAIEIALAKLPLKAQNHYQPTKQIGLQLPLSVLREKIVERVDQRLEAGVMKEVQQFGLHHPDSNLQAKTALGYQEINQFLKGELALEELKTTWAISEFQYAKRQQTWWKKQVGIKWLHTKWRPTDCLLTSKKL